MPDGSHLPAFAIALYTRLPTGSASRSLGSGVTNYQLYGVAQKSLTKNTKISANAGVLFAGNTVIGVVGVGTAGGKIVSGGGALVKP